MTESHTPEFALRIRLKTLPPGGEFAEFDFSHFRAGGTFVVPARLASVLIIAGYAELIDDRPPRAEAADFGGPTLPQRR